VVVRLYSVPDQFQYDDFSDDRARGQGANPFGNYAPPYAQPPNKELLYGPFAGDTAFISYNLYTDASLHARAGTAILICVYDLAKISYCSAALNLNDGALVGLGTFPFHASQFTIVIDGGSGKYAGAKGQVTAVFSPAARSKSTPIFANPPGVIGQAQQLTLSVSGPGKRAGSGPTDVYAYPDSEQYLDHNDDEARGTADNPFGARVYAQCIGLPHPREVTCSDLATQRASAVVKEHNNGPFAGDQAVFSLKVYATPARTAEKGTATLTCQYDFAKNGFCNETIQFKDGTLFAAGTFNFNAKQFALPVTGGTGAYAGLSGEVTEAPGANHTEHLSFALTRSA
jgi:hypothetical protein